MTSFLILLLLLLLLLLSIIFTPFSLPSPSSLSPSFHPFFISSQTDSSGTLSVSPPFNISEEVSDDQKKLEVGSSSFISDIHQKPIDKLKISLSQSPISLSSVSSSSSSSSPLSSSFSSSSISSHHNNNEGIVGVDRVTSISASDSSKAHRTFPPTSMPTIPLTNLIPISFKQTHPLTPPQSKLPILSSSSSPTSLSGPPLNVSFNPSSSSSSSSSSHCGFYSELPSSIKVANRSSMIPGSHDESCQSRYPDLDLNDLKLEWLREKQTVHSFPTSLYIAINLYENQAILPDFSLELLRTLYLIDSIGVKDVHLAIYESGSTDSTPSSLKLLDLLLDPYSSQTASNHSCRSESFHSSFFALKYRFSHSIIVQGEITKASLRPYHRIQFLSQVRNAVMKDIYKEKELPTNRRKFEKILFINDILFCAHDVSSASINPLISLHPPLNSFTQLLYWMRICLLMMCSTIINIMPTTQVLRLLSHPEADLVCGLDFDVPLDEHQSEIQSKPKPLFYDTSSSDDCVNAVAHQVARDRSGAAFSKIHPYMEYQSDFIAVSSLSIYRPFAVSCCWNGMVLMRSAPFLESGIYFRAGNADDESDQECAASECSQLCIDFIRLGFDRILIDPVVLVAYEREVFADIAKQEWFLENIHRRERVSREGWWSEDDERKLIRFIDNHQPPPTQIWCCPLDSHGQPAPCKQQRIRSAK